MCDLLPRFVHDVLDKVEFSLSLPVLAVVVLCTLQFAFSQSMHIACIVNDILCKRARRINRCCPGPKPRRQCDSDPCCGLVSWLKAIISCWFKTQCADEIPKKPCKPIAKRRCPKKKCSTKPGDSDDDEFDF